MMTTRWAMSYLRGPLTRDQIGQALALSEPAAAAPPAAAPAPAAPAPAAPAAAAAPPAAPAAPAPVPAAPAPVPVSPLTVPPATAGADESPVMPTIASGVPVAYVDPAAPWLPLVGGVSGGQHLRAAAVARVDLTFDEGTDVVATEEFEAVLMPLTQVPDPRLFVAVDYDDRDLVTTAPSGAVYGLVPSEAKAKTYWNSLQKSLVDELVRSRTTEVLVNTDLKAMARPGETREQFVARCHTLVDAAADKELTTLRSKYETKLTSARVKLSDAQINAQVLEQEYDANYGLAATGISVLGGLLGGRRSRSSMASQAKKQSAANAKVGAAQTKATALQQAVADLEAELQTELLEVDARWNAKAENVTTKSIPLEKSDVVVRDFRLVWVPVA